MIKIMLDRLSESDYECDTKLLSKCFDSFYNNKTIELDGKIYLIEKATASTNDNEDIITEFNALVSIKENVTDKETIVFHEKHYTKEQLITIIHKQKEEIENMRIHSGPLGDH